MMFWLVRVKLQLNGGLVQRFLSKAALFALFVSLPLNIVSCAFSLLTWVSFGVSRQLNHRTSTRGVLVEATSGRMSNQKVA